MIALLSDLKKRLSFFSLFPNVEKLDFVNFPMSYSRPYFVTLTQTV